MSTKPLKTSLKDVEILESWKWNLDEMKEEMNTLRRKIAKAETERKLQPPLLMKTELFGEYVVVNRYCIVNNNMFIAESKRPATDDDMKVLMEE